MTGSLGRTIHRAGILVLLVVVLLWPSAHPVASETVALNEIQSIGQTELGVGATADVWWEVECGAPGIAVTLQPEMYADAQVGRNLLFGETIELSADAAPGDYNCTVTFWVDTGAGEGAPFEQQMIRITVEPPEEIPQELPEQLPYMAVPVDIKPGSCRNPLNIKSRGVLPVAILGTEDFDVSQIDPETVRLTGIAPLRWSTEDVATPFEPFVGKEDAFDCTTDGPDGFLDLALKFSTQEIVNALDEVSDGDVLVLELHGELFDGTSFEGEDVVVILKKGKK